MKSDPKSLEELIPDLIQRVTNLAGGIQPGVARHFAQRFFHFLPYTEILGGNEDQLAESAAMMLHHIATYRGPEPKVSVFVPNGTRKFHHTVVAVLQPDSPFLVDSIRMELVRRDLHVHSILSVVVDAERNAEGILTEVLGPATEGSERARKEAAIYVETDLIDDEAEAEALRASIEDVLKDVRLVVQDFPAMREHALAEAARLAEAAPPLPPEEIEETRAFLEWLADDHFIFLGFDEHQIVEDDEGQRVLEPAKGSALGTTKRHNRRRWILAELPEQARRFVEAPAILAFVNAPHRSRVHRPVYPDYIAVKRFDEAGRVISSCRFLGLFTSSVFNELPRETPIIRKKVGEVLERSGFAPGGHYQKALQGVLNAYPRDELFQAGTAELFETAMGIVQVQESPRVRLFLRRNPYGRFFYCLVFVPREFFHTELRQKIQAILCRRLKADDVEINTHMGETELARLRFLIRLPEGTSVDVDVKELEREMVEASLSWDDAFYHQLRQIRGERDALLLRRTYREAFPASYRDHFNAITAFLDLSHIEELEQGAELSLRLTQNPEDSKGLRFRLFRKDEPVPLSDVLPILENMGLRSNSEHPYRIARNDGGVFWIHEFNLIPNFPVAIESERVSELFRDAFLQIWRGVAENDRFNALILGACITWREVVMLRAYARYNRQARFLFGNAYTAETLTRHLPIACLLVRYFRTRFDPALVSDRAKTARRIERDIIHNLDLVPSLNEDQVLRRFLELMQATLRTNFFQEDGSPGQGEKAEGDGDRPKDYLSFKFAPAGISGLPLPRPAFEIYVYSRRMEGIHLRGGKIARGGLRWSDRPEDFRTEVLGLVKAQQVKNAVIVPVGAKGGFVAHQLPVGDRGAIVEEGKRCYRTFLRGLLDLTDNLVDGEVIPPERVVRHDPDDPYLVVAADKGTATFSDIGNAISAEYGFWMGDAFASGGSEGYDHKKMGITARGAWVSVQRHFCELGVNVQTDPITVIGIGDMGGDVFGNGMLRSEEIRLIAAFNHLHILIDPDPDPAASFAERRRLFDRVAGWGQYDESLLSEGGAVYSREMKVIELSPQARERFGIEEQRLTPGALLSALLRAPVDLLWNGGIGTFAKAESESHEDAGDRGNDAVRVNARELGCRVIAEGGNLGFTQRARVEFCLHGGICNTDFIDNSAGVDCSDHEVNLKILLNGLEAKGELDREARNGLLVSMTGEVSALVLQHNYRQARAISLADAQSLKRTVEYLRLLDHWERDGIINRSLEALPDDESLSERASHGKGLTRPELAVLVTYAKSHLKQVLVDSDVPDDPLMSQLVTASFPPSFVKRFGEDLTRHPLRREIVATQWANEMINYMGPSYIYRLEESTGATPAEITRAFAAAREIFSLPELWERIEALDYEIDPGVQHQMMYELSRLVRRASRWLLRNCRAQLGDVSSLAKSFKPGVDEIGLTLRSLLHDAALAFWKRNHKRFTAAGVPEDLASAIAGSSGLYSSLGVIFAAGRTETPIDTCSQVYFSASDHLDLHWLSYRIRDLKVEDHWQARARESFRDELHIQQRQLTIRILTEFPKGDPASRIQSWLDARRHHVERWQDVLEEFRAAGSRNYAMYPVMLRELAVLVGNT